MEHGERHAPEDTSFVEVSEAASRAATLLYVEDNAANRELVAQVVAAFRPDLRLLLAVNAEEGLAMARRSPQPGLILLDLNLPGLSGEDAFAQLNADSCTAAMPVIILSGDATTRSRKRLLAAGVRAYLTKPFNVQQFLDLLSELLPAPSQQEEVPGAFEHAGHI